MDKLQSMTVFDQVVAANGFAAGARKLGMSPPRVTRLIKDLEDHLGVQLLQRTTRRFALTTAGAAYLDRVRSILSDVDAAEEAALSHVREMAGSVRVQSLPGMPTYLVTPAIAQFRREHPSVTVELRSDVQASRNIEGHDITLLTDHVPLRSDAVVRRLVDSHSVLCASPDYVRRHGAPGAPQELPQHAFVRFVPPEEPPRPLDLVDESDPSRHQRVLSPWICERSTLVATYASRRHMPVRTRAFLDHLLAHAQQAMAEIEPSPVAP